MANWMKVLTTYHLFYQPCWFERHLDYKTLFAGGLIAFLKSRSFWKCNTFLISSNIVLIILKDHKIQIKILLNSIHLMKRHMSVKYYIYDWPVIASWRIVRPKSSWLSYQLLVRPDKGTLSKMALWHCVHRLRNWISVCKCVTTRLYLHNPFFKAWIYEPPNDKTNKMSVCPVKTQISLGICPVWSVLLCA